jgi:hypothetical protein
MAVFASSVAETANPFSIYFVPEAEIAFPGGVFLPAKLRDSDRSGNQRFIRRRPDYSQQRPQRGECFMQFGELFWFEHLHIIPRSISLGPVLSTQEREYEIFNGFRSTTKDITNIVEDGLQGFTLTNDPTLSPETSLGPKGTIVVSVSVSPIGPVTIAAEIVYTFDGGESLTITFTGSRVIIMATEPQAQIEEVWEWQTDIIQAASGDEQRIMTRDVPRQSLVYRFVKEDGNLARLRNQLWAWAANTWALPVWTDYTELSADAAAGSTSLSVVTTDDRDFRAGTNELALIWQDEDNFEAVEVSALTSNSLTLARETLAAFSAGALVMPVRLALLRNNWTGSQPNFGARDAAVQWQIRNSVSWEDALSPRAIDAGGTYRSLPVWDIDSDYLVTSGSYSESEDRSLRVAADDGTGKFITSTPRKYPQNRLTGIEMQAFGREEFFRLRSFLHGLRGQQKAVWVSTGRQDFTVESATTAPSTEVNVEIVDYTNLVAGAPDGPRTRRNIEIVYADGTKDYRRIISAQVTAGVREVLTLDAGISQDCTIANISRISYLVKRRLGTDRLTFRHEFYEGEATVGPINLVDVYDGE